MQRRHFLSGSLITLGMMATNVGSTVPLAPARNIVVDAPVADGKTLNTRSIQLAIDDTFRVGGGLVYAPRGTFLIGGSELKSRVTLYVEAGCILLGSTSIRDYEYYPGPPVAGDANGHHVIFAYKAEDIALSRHGMIDGQGPAYWRNVQRAPVPIEDDWEDVATFDYLPIDNLRPSPMIELAVCCNVCISGATLKNASGWTLRSIACEMVIIKSIRIRNLNIGPNTDGLDNTASRNAFQSNCDIATGDDAICLKSENPYGDLPPTKNGTVTSCVLPTSCNGFEIGTGTHGAFENIAFSNLLIYNEDSSPPNSHVIGGINIEMVDGGSVGVVTVSNIRMQNVRTPIFVRLGERTRKAGSFLRDILLSGIDAPRAVVANSITGVAGPRLHDITVSGCRRFRTVEGGKEGWAHRVRLHDVEFSLDKPDERPAVVCEDVQDLILSSLDRSVPTGDSPLIDLRNVQRAFLSSMSAPAGVPVFAQVSGAGSSGTALSGISLGQGQRALSYTAGANRGCRDTKHIMEPQC